MDKDIFYDLRPEAKPFEFEKLTKGQQEAFKQTLDIIEKGVKALDEYNTEKKKREKKTLEPNIFEVLKKNHNRLVFLSGGRGSGKTSVLYSLIQSLENKDGDENSENKDTEKEKCSAEIKLDNKIKDLKRRVIWLRPLEMDTIPGPTNLLAAILTRIGEVLDRFDIQCEQASNHAFPPSHAENYQNVLTKFERLQRDVAKAWSGNLEQHAARMESDPYAVEVLNTERCRFKLDERLRESLSDLNTLIKCYKSQKDFLFILPVDDFDLNPYVSVNLARLVRLTTVPHLFTIIGGDINMAQNIFNIHASTNLSRFNPKILPSDDKLIKRLTHEYSANTMRKLFPLSHTIRLELMDWEEVLGFNPGHHNSKRPESEDTIKDFLEQIKIEINTAATKDPLDNNKEKSQYIACKKINNLKDFFTFRVESLISGLGSRTNKDITQERLNTIYFAPFLFTVHPRHAQDLWRYLFKKTKEDPANQKQKKDPANQKPMIFARKLFLQAANEGVNLSKEICDDLLESKESDFTGKIQFNTKRLRLENVAGPTLRLCKSNQTNKENSSIILRQPKDWLLTIQRKESDENLILSNPTTASLIFLHDLTTLSNPRQLINNSLMKKMDPPYWAYALWPEGHKRGISVRWLAPLWKSMWEYDILRRCWVKVWEWFETNTALLKKSDMVVDLAAYYWTKINTGIISGSCIDIKSLNEFITEKSIEKKIEIKEKIPNLLQESKQASDEIPNIIKLLKSIVDKIRDNNPNTDKDYKTLKEFINSSSLIHLPSIENNKNNTPKFYPYLQPNSCMGSGPHICLDNAWKILINEVAHLAEEIDLTNVCGRRNTLIRSWLARIACNLAPESGVSNEITQKFIAKEPIRKAWEKQEIAQEIRISRAWSAAEFFDHQVLSKMLDLYAPKYRERFHEREQIQKAIEINDINELCPYIEDICSFSKLNRKIKDQYLEKLKPHR